jgi:hypothetical protein
MNDAKFEELMESVREADAILKPHLSACHRLIQSDPYYEQWKAAALKYIEQRAAGEKPDMTELQRLGMEAINRACSRYIASLNREDEP